MHLYIRLIIEKQEKGNNGTDQNFAIIVRGSAINTRHCRAIRNYKTKKMLDYVVLLTLIEYLWGLFGLFQRIVHF